jgi:hypothetical protein
VPDLLPKEKTMQEHIHPQSGATLSGMRLAVGAILRQDDRYDSSDGKWRSCNHTAGNKIEPGCTTVWVRPNVSLSDHAMVLLCVLARREEGRASYISERDGVQYLLPTPTWNWDGRVALKSLRHPECVQELVDYGYLALSKHEIKNPDSDYAVCRMGAKNEVYSLTEEGKKEAALLKGS